MPRLPKGMFKRGRSYYVRIRLEGRDRWVCLGSELGQAVVKLQRIRGGETPLGDRTSVVEAARRWLASYVETARNPKGRQLTAARVVKYLGRFFRFVPVVKVGPDGLRRYRLWLEGQRLEPATVAHVLSDARCFFRWCEEVGLVERAPVPRRLLPRLQERPPDRLADEEVAKVLAVPEPHGFVVRLALGTGLRWGELTRAQASHVEAGMLVVSQTKSGKVRRVPLGPDLLKEVRHRVGRLVPYAERSPGSFAKAIRKATGIAGFHVHKLRHTFACRWVEQGGNLAALQQVLGHASIVTTQRYARLSDEAVRREAERLVAAREGTA